MRLPVLLVVALHAVRCLHSGRCLYSPYPYPLRSLCQESTMEPAASRVPIIAAPYGVYVTPYVGLLAGQGRRYGVTAGLPWDIHAELRTPYSVQVQEREADPCPPSHALRHAAVPACCGRQTACAASSTFPGTPPSIISPARAGLGKRRNSNIARIALCAPTINLHDFSPPWLPPPWLLCFRPELARPGQDSPPISLWGLYATAQWA